MRSRIMKVVAGLAAIAALALGGATLASADQGVPQASSGQQVQDTTGAPDATAAESESTESSAAAEVGAAAESVVGDGPGGWADNPNDPNAQHEFQGVE